MKLEHLKSQIFEKAAVVGNCGTKKMRWQEYVANDENMRRHEVAEQEDAVTFLCFEVLSLFLHSLDCRLLFMVID